MKIVLYTTSFLPGIGGRQIVVHYLAEALTKLGHQARVMGPGGCWSHRKVRFNYPVHRWPSLPGGILAEREMVCKLLVDTAVWGCDIIHAHSTYPCGYTAAQLKSIKNLPLVVTPHGEDIHVIPEIGFGFRLDSLRRRKINHALEEAEILTSISNSIEDSLLNAGASQHKIRSIPNGIDIERFQTPVEKDVRKWLKLEADTRLIVTVGRYHPRKGQEVLINAMPLILVEEPRVRLIIIGKDPEPLKPLIQKLNMDDKVKLTGKIDFPQLNNGVKGSPSVIGNTDWLAAIYQSSEMYVSAGISEGAEGLSLAMLDAMAAGLPIVATDISGNKDVIRNGQAGYLVPPSDPAQLAYAVVRLLRRKNLRVQMGKESQAIARDYCWSSIAEKYLRVYHEARERNKRNIGR